MNIILTSSLLLLCIILSGCKPSEPDALGQDTQGKPLSDSFVLTQTELSRYTPEEQFMIVNKALSTIYRGLPADEFFDLTQGLNNPVLQSNTVLRQLQVDLQTPLTSAQRIQYNQDILGVDDDPSTDADETVPARFTNFDNDQPHQIYMARIQGYPVSRDQFVTFMSYFLANTIMFSPAREMDSTNSQDVVRVLGYLEESISQGKSIRDVVRGWLHNLSRWRVSRSPENHALEMFELYLGVFNDTPEEQLNTLNGGKVCGSWYLTDNDADYQLLKDLTKIESDQAFTVFGQYVTNCEDLYDVVAGHPLLIPRVTEVIVNYFLDGIDASKKTKLIQNIVSSGPTTFEDVFLGVIFSKTFLLESERPKTFEENAWNFLHAMHYTPRAGSGSLNSRVLDNMLDSSNNGNAIAVHNMGWAAMDYKIGRTPFLPMDVLSFATYHKGMREGVLLNNRAFDGCSHPGTKYKGCYNKRTEEELAEFAGLPFEEHSGAFYLPGTEDLKPELENLTASEFIDVIFLTALGRRASAEEQSAFMLEADIDHRYYIKEDEDTGIIRLRPTTNGDEIWENRTDDFAEIMLDYISRLPEFYYYRAVTQ